MMYDKAKVVPLLFVVSCSPFAAPTADLLDSVSDDELAQSRLPLGLAYDSFHSNLLAKACVSDGILTSERLNTPVRFLDSKFEIFNDASFDTLSATLGLDLSGTLSLSNEADLKGKLKYARTNSSATNSVAQTFVVSVRSEPITLMEETLEPAQRALVFLKNLETDHDGDGTPDISAEEIIARRRAVCGDSYVSSLFYLATLSATIKLEFATEKDKKDLSSRISIVRKENAAGDFDVGFSGSQLTESEKGQVKLVINGHQQGARVAELLRFIPDGTITCSIDDVAPCLDVFNAIKEYARQGFVDQLATATLGDLVPTAARTTRYDESWSLSELDPNFVRF